MYISEELTEYIDDFKNDLPVNDQYTSDPPNVFSLAERFETIEEEDDE